jgi:hypothetical protein
MTEFVEITTPELSELAHKLMLEDDHGCPMMTHVVMRDGQITGAFSVFFLPCVFAWFDTRVHQPLAVFKFYKWIQKTGLEKGHKRLIWPCTTKSPFYQYLGKVGYRDIGACNILM